MAPNGGRWPRGGGPAQTATVMTATGPLDWETSQRTRRDARYAPQCRAEGLISAKPPSQAEGLIGASPGWAASRSRAASPSGAERRTGAVDPALRLARQLRGLRLGMGALDTAAVLLAAGAAQRWGGRLPFAQPQPAHPHTALLFAVGWVTLLLLHRAQSPHALGTGSAELGRVARASALWAGAVGAAAYLGDLPLCRARYLVAASLGTALLLLGRLGGGLLLRRLRARGRLTHRLILVGAPAQVDAVAAALARQPALGVRVLGAATPAGAGATTPGGVPVLGSATGLLGAVVRARPTGVAFVGGAPGPAEMRETLWELGERNVALFWVPGLTDVAPGRVALQPVGGLPLLQVAPSRHRRAERSPKRAFDVLGAAALLLVLGPVLGLAAAVVRLHDGGPTLFRQVRVGRDGAPFTCLKLRTMVVDAPAREAELRRAHQSRGEVLFKLAADPRVTAPGRWLRRWSLDELPQLWNVLRGDMSLVGPRPALPHEVARYTAAERRRLLVRPGLTGLWQVSGRANLPRAEAARLDLCYVENWSLGQDLRILLRTVRAVATAEGAY